MDEMSNFIFWSENIQTEILGEYKKRSEKNLFGVTTKIVTKLNKYKSKCANFTTRIKLKDQQNFNGNKP